ncbi:hypothetical protein DUNSADRAFT_10653 [Dunaliella salina]|uniref:RING-CH-type domain-containing protein n=1 Tax=Dunaliella salina TaxID=3046 RepID=A0ABQ7GF25_DUNSA|nr:hypothetical protein DUNSADRAFT_10653 [Dunaliella salina]|eukprot:KAF5833134.1 hypothetical protein DUNSADRAFT_10653 [Dunaliella salina]
MKSNQHEREAESQDPAESQHLLEGRDVESQSRSAASPPQQHQAPESRESNGEPRVCRICFDGEDPEEARTNPLISPCCCSGSSSFCLQKWRETSKHSSRSQAFYRCEVCHYEYQFKRLDHAAFLAHPVFVGILFALLLTSSSFLLGFVPIIQACLAAYDINPQGWGHAAIHFMDGMMLLGLVGLVWMNGSAANVRRPSRPSPFFCTPDATPCTCFADAGCGEACGPLVLILIAALAVIGLAVSIPAAITFLYEKVDQAAGKTVEMGSYPWRCFKGSYP